MKVYDRYRPRANRRRRQYALCGKNPRLYRFVWLAKWSLLCYAGAAAGMALIELLAGALGGDFSGIPLFPAWAYICAILVCGSVLTFYIADSGPDMINLHTMGIEGSRFRALTIQYQACMEMDAADLWTIRIVPGCRSMERFSALGRSFGWRIRDFSARRRRNEPLCLPYVRLMKLGPGLRFAAVPMAMLIPRLEACNPRWLRAKRPLDGNFVLNHLNFAIIGDNEEAFVQLLRSSECPVMIRKGYYQRHAAGLNALFEQSGMDMNRLRIEA